MLVIPVLVDLRCGSINKVSSLLDPTLVLFPFLCISSF
ncbi:unnamed protein product [Arabidopsis lyrata]|uniref:Uncharacterized protein n=1 Tax=Arabidopsis thaliana x Arabidopsis arenosa TaxID=1240361 RepID=A0A8T2C0N4_9BRAS|nr:hypothetical protein ISN45_Aa01g023980 [Arabidopsis thaliana x Arabidopsis arenosa]CAH8275388.1 unnamed protein product [Arabidopsis lyrata]